PYAEDPEDDVVSISAPVVDVEEHVLAGRYPVRPLGSAVHRIPVVVVDDRERVAEVRHVAGTEDDQELRAGQPHIPEDSDLLKLAVADADLEDHAPLEVQSFVAWPPDEDRCPPES